MTAALTGAEKFVTIMQKKMHGLPLTINRTAACRMPATTDWSGRMGEYVLFVDSDDYLEPQACANLWKEARAGFADIIISKMALEKPSEGMARFEKVAEDRFQYHRIYSGPAYLMGCLEGGALRVEVIRTMFRRDFLVRNDLYFEYGILHEDEEFTPRALLKAERVVLTDYVYYHYDNSRSDSIMNSTALNAKKIADRVKIYDGLRKLYKTVKPRKAAQASGR